MNGDEVQRVERAMDRQADKIGAAINGLGEKIGTVGNRVTRVETKLEDHIEYSQPTEITGVGPAPQPDGLVIPWRVMLTGTGILAAGGGGWELLRGLLGG